MSRTLHEDLNTILLLLAVGNILYVNKANTTHCCLSMETVLRARVSNYKGNALFLSMARMVMRTLLCCVIRIYSFYFSPYQNHSTNASRSSVIQPMARAPTDRSFLVIKSEPTKRIKNVPYDDSSVYMSRIQFLHFTIWVCLLLLRSSL